jgi:hypothetical protein
LFISLKTYVRLEEKDNRKKKKKKSGRGSVETESTCFVSTEPKFLFSWNVLVSEE